MGHKNGNLTYQISQQYKSMGTYGESKHMAKTDGTMNVKIFSYATMKAYIQHGVDFGKYCKKQHGVKSIEACRRYVADYIRYRSEKYSPSTVKLDLAALAKLFRCRATDFGVETAPRTRATTTRSRRPVQMDKHFSETKNADLVSFCRSTGLRRCELKAIHGNQLRIIDGSVYIKIIGNQGKGGKERLVPVIGNIDLVVRLMTAAGDNKVFGKIHSAADIHGYRADYAASLYKQYARPLAVCKSDQFYNSTRHRMDRNSVYYCRRDQCGKWYDKKAMLIVSHSLGHNRICVVGENYLYKVE